MTFLEDAETDGLCKVLSGEPLIMIVNKTDLNLPIINTKDYEKIGTQKISD